jgi:NADH-quinone oxidoreductase subunit L
MLSWLWLIPALPFAGCLMLVLSADRLSRRAIAWIGVGSIGLSAAISVLVGIRFVQGGLQPYRQTLWTWMDVGGFNPQIALYLDALSLVMTLVITFVGFLIHLYSAEFMSGDEGYGRFFAYMNLFVASMLTLVLGDNLLLLYLGWEGVGLCSYLLIGFWYTEPANGYAAQKAFIVTRIGDTAFAVALFILFAQLGTLDIQEVMRQAARQWEVGSSVSIAVAGLLLVGALGKSAQLPLQTWLPDAMAGPTPVSALIHAATMVTAGVYLIARTHVLFTLAPAVQFAVAVIGALTLLIAACSALTQQDIKRALAYSTMSQVGYMFLALGVGAWSAALFHFITHAFFKALLFLAAGVVIVNLHHEHNIFKMGGLRKDLPLTHAAFVIGAASLAGLPFITAGFYSKELILSQTWSSASGGFWLWAAGVCGAFLTAVYSFRLVFSVFYGTQKTVPDGRPGWTMAVPLIILAGLSLIAGIVELPAAFGNVHVFSTFMESALPAMDEGDSHAAVLLTQVIVIAITLLGVFLAYLVFLRRPELMTGLSQTPMGAAFVRFWAEGWAFDRLYNRIFVQPFLRLAGAVGHDLFDQIPDRLIAASRFFYRLLHLTQTGRIRWYAAVLAVGSILLLAVVVWS